MRAWLPLLVALTLPTTAAAQEQRIGGSLKPSANNAFTCATLPATGAGGERFPLPTGVSTCTYLATGSIRDFSRQVVAPTTGVATAVRVKVGPRTGAMRITVLRAIRSTVAGFACCFHEGQSRIFTPAPNAVTTVRVRLPMVVAIDKDPKVGEVVDRLGLTVLGPGVPVPAHDYRAAGDVTKPGSLIFSPHVRPGDVRADGGGYGAITPLMNADFRPDEGAQPLPEPAPAPAPDPEPPLPQPAPAPLPDPVPVPPGGGAVTSALTLTVRCGLALGCTTMIPSGALVLPIV